MNSDDHFRHLAEFIKGVELAGGTTPHVAMTVTAIDRLEDPLEKLWFAGCYALVYNWPTAERIFLEWRPEEFNPLDFRMWTEENWAGLPMRKERKAVFRKDFFVESARTYLDFAADLADTDQSDWPKTYAKAFDGFLLDCKYMGRYIGIRWMEVMRRAFGHPWTMPDLANSGGEHPRKALALIYPRDSAALLGGNSKENIRVADQAADRCLLDLNLEYGIDIGYYDLQSLLCEYKQSALGQKQYPGKSVDTELDYFARVYAHWGSDKAAQSQFWDIRQECFPKWSLGEKQGWAGSRKDLGGVLANHGYTWSDAIYDYSATTDLAAPQMRAEGLGSLL